MNAPTSSALVSGCYCGAPGKHVSVVPAVDEDDEPTGGVHVFLYCDVHWAGMQELARIVANLGGYGGPGDGEPLPEPTVHTALTG